jgi:hypothetical protein
VSAALAVRAVPTLPTPKPFASRQPAYRTGSPRYPVAAHPPTWLPPGTAIPSLRAVVGPDGVAPVWPVLTPGRTTP